MEILLFTATAIVLYVVSDGIVKAIEKRNGKLLKNRSIIFFAIIAVLSTVTFNLIQNYGPQLGLLPTPPIQEAVSPAPQIGQ